MTVSQRIYLSQRGVRGAPGPTVTAQAGNAVATRTLLAGIASPQANQLALLTESGREGLFVFVLANLSSLVTADTQQGIYVAPSSDTTGASGAWVREYTGPANVTWFGVSTSATDNASAFTAAFSNASKVHIPAGTFVVSALSIPANTEITTAGFNTIIKRQSGIADGTRIVNINGSNVRLGDIAVQGLIASETGEQNHGLFIQGNTANGNLQNITVGNVKATDIRGDAVYVGSANSKTVSQVKIGQIYANNCWRNGLSVADSVTELDVESVYEVACGQHTVDIEPNSAATGPGIRIGAIRGRHLQLAGTAGAINGVEIGSAELDLTYGSNSTPANPVDHKTGSQATGTDNAVVVSGAVAKIGRLSANGYTGQAIIGASGAITAQLSVDSASITNCCSSDTVYNAYIQGPAEYRFGTLTATTTLATHSVFSTCTNSQVGKATVALVTSSKYFSNCTDCRTDELNMSVSGAGNGGFALYNSTRCFVGGGTQTGDRFFSGATNCVAMTVTATMATSYDSSGTNNTWIASKQGGTFVAFQQNGSYALDASGNFLSPGYLQSSSATALSGYHAGAGGTVTQATSRTTGVTLSKPCGQITLVSAAGSAAYQTFTVTNTLVAATDEPRVWQVSGTDKYLISVTRVAAGAFDITFATTGGTTTEQPVFGFAVKRAVTA